MCRSYYLWNNIYIEIDHSVYSFHEYMNVLDTVLGSGDTAVYKTPKFPFSWNFYSCGGMCIGRKERAVRVKQKKVVEEVVRCDG